MVIKPCNTDGMNMLKKNGPHSKIKMVHKKPKKFCACGAFTTKLHVFLPNNPKKTFDLVHKTQIWSNFWSTLVKIVHKTPEKPKKFFACGAQKRSTTFLKWSTNFHLRRKWLVHVCNTHTPLIRSVIFCDTF